jgi:hypothetical protein
MRVAMNESGLYQSALHSQHTAYQRYPKNQDMRRNSPNNQEYPKQSLW